MKKLKLRILIQYIIVLYCTAFFLQAGAQEKSKFTGINFLLSGDAYMGLRYTHNPTNDAKSFTFTNMGVNPVFLWKLSNKMIFEGEVEFQNRNPHPTGYAVG